MSSCCRRKLKVRRQLAVDIGCSCTPKLITSLFSSSSSRSRLKATKSFTHSSCLTTTTYNTSSSWDPTGIATSTTSTPPPPPPLTSSDRSNDPVNLSTDRRRRGRKKKPATAAATAADVNEEEGRVARESVAVVKETSDPYAAFRESMTQMIAEKEIYGWDELNDLLNRFISLNSPRHHHLILTAFADLCNGVFSSPSPLAASATAPEADYNYSPRPSPMSRHNLTTSS